MGAGVRYVNAHNRVEMDHNDEGIPIPIPRPFNS